MTAGTPTRGRPYELVLIGGFALLGVLAGIAAKAADESGWTWAADLGTYPAGWVLAVALIGRFAPGLGAAAGRAAAFFAAMTAAYYAWAVAVLGFGFEPELIVSWLLLSATAVAAVAAACWWSTRRPGFVPGTLLALTAGTALAGGALRRLYLWWGVDDAMDLHPLQAGVEVLVALVVALALPQHRSTRIWALALTVPMWWLASEVLEVVYGFLA